MAWVRLLHLYVDTDPDQPAYLTAKIKWVAGGKNLSTDLGRVNTKIGIANNYFGDTPIGMMLRAGSASLEYRVYFTKYTPDHYCGGTVKIQPQ